MNDARIKRIQEINGWGTQGAVLASLRQVARETEEDLVKATPTMGTCPAWAQITDADRAFLASVADSLLTARSKYPGNSGRYIALTGEAGEAFHAMQKVLTKRGSLHELGEELRQVAAMACRLAVEGDAMLSQGMQNQFPVITHPGTTIEPHQPGWKA